MGIIALALSCLPVRAHTQSRALRRAIDSVLAKPEFKGTSWSIVVLDAERNRTLYSHNGAKALVPASNMKLITAAAALASLGPGFRFSTTFTTNGTIRDSAITGDLIVNGTGDPSFSTRMRGDAMIPMRELADSLRARGIIRIEGRLRRGRPVFVDSPIGLGWEWEDLSAAYGATVGDLMFNESFTGVRVELQGVTDTAKRGTRRTFLDAFGAALAERGIAYAGIDWAVPAPDTALTTLFAYQSPPLRDIFPPFLKSSQNQIGEILLRTIGLVRTGVGRADSGSAVVERQLLAWGADSIGFAVRDGSGLTRHDLASAETLVRTMRAARRDSTFGVLFASLPIAGVDGTLERRLRGTTAENNVRAKTGSMDRVRAVSGFATSADRHQIIFSVIANGFVTSPATIDAAIDTIVVRIASAKLR
jgi:D-alanyl-D-alanine carboxypeptidase/D-alanyl-D-alanine-endopeptidase (penicillin-binding protein 4)